MNEKIPNILDGVEEAFGVLFHSAELWTLHFWMHVLVGLGMLFVLGKLMMRYVGNVELRWVPLSVALLVPLLAWVLAWAAADVWLVPMVSAVGATALKHLVALLMGVVFAYFVVVWSDAITRTHAVISLAITYIGFVLMLFCADFLIAKTSAGVDGVQEKVEQQIQK